MNTAVASSLATIRRLHIQLTLAVLLADCALGCQELNFSNSSLIAAFDHNHLLWFSCFVLTCTQSSPVSCQIKPSLAVLTLLFVIGRWRVRTRRRRTTQKIQSEPDGIKLQEICHRDHYKELCVCILNNRSNKHRQRKKHQLWFALQSKMRTI